MTGKQLGGPTVLRTDNKAAHHLSYNPLKKKGGGQKKRGVKKKGLADNK